MVTHGKGKPPKEHPAVPRLCPGGTVAVLGTGPSLAQADVDRCRGLDAVIAVNDSYRVAPWATVLYAADAKWWRWHPDAAKFAGLKYALDGVRAPGVQVLRRGPETGLATDPTLVALGRNGCYQAINVAVHLGASQILLLGVDMCNGPRADGQGRSDHFFGHHPDNTGPDFDVCRQRFATLVGPLAQLGVDVLNCSRRTALKAFPLVPLEDALSRRAA